MRTEQTVSEMVVEVLARQAEELSEREGRPFENAFVEVLDTPAGRLLTELADGSHRNERAAEWQTHLIADRLSQRPATFLGGRAGTAEGRYGAKGQKMQTRILLVEDNEDFRAAFARMLELELAPELDVAFAQADSIAGAHALLQEEDGLDAALVDVGLPDGDGLDLVRELEGDGLGIPALPTLVITANLEHSVAARAMEAGARGVLSKMVPVKETAETVQSLVGEGHFSG
jgi:CheY-like chemotaxis protein